MGQLVVFVWIHQHWAALLSVLVALNMLLDALGNLGIKWAKDAENLLSALLAKLGKKTP